MFQLDSSSINAIRCKSFKASLNGSSITLHNRLVNTSLVAKLDHAELHRSAEIRLDTEQLSRCGVQVNEIFLLSNVNETCTVWAQLMSPAGGRFSRSIDAAKEKATDQDPPPSTKLPKFASVLSRVITWPLAKQAIRRDTRVRNRCERKDFIVSFDELSSSPNYVTIPDTFNMGMCKGMCTTIQCKNNNAFLRGLINDIFKDDKAAPKEVRLWFFLLKHLSFI